MPKIEKVDDQTLKLGLELADALAMIGRASQDVALYAADIVTIYEKMPFFDYVNFCFYAYDSARLFEWVLGMNPKEYQSFSLDAPDGFFYTLYGGMAALYEDAKESLAQTA